MNTLNKIGHQAPKPYRMDEKVESVEAIQFWTDNIKVLGHWKLQPKFGQLKSSLSSEKKLPSNIMIVGGDFSDENILFRESSIIKKLSLLFDAKCTNGGSIDDLKNSTDLSGYDMAIWGANVDNSIEKLYPKKSIGSVLFCTKVLRDNRDIGDAVARIFKMRANAVIAINTDKKPFIFNLIDALGNLWCSTSDLKILKKSMLDFYNWSKNSIRMKSEKASMDVIKPKLDDLCDIVKVIADKVENERGGRYFGNVSTRCSKMFPSMRTYENMVLVSGRNTPKDRLTSNDFIFTELDENKVLYAGDSKPSVDTPIQLILYKKLKKVNYMIHGHAYIENTIYTEHYFPCGDLRELDAIIEKVDHKTTSFILNLKNHGFIIGTENIEALKKYAESLNFKYREIGTESIK